MAGLKDSISKGFTTVNVKSSNLMEKNKIKTYISTLEKEIAELQRQIGELAFSSWEQGDINIDLLTPRFLEIKSKRAEIAAQQEKSMELDRMEQQILGAPSAPDTAYCFCMSCGTRNEQKNKFCVKCGSPLR